LLLKRCPNHEFSEKQYLQIFTEGLSPNNMMFLDASAGGSLKSKIDNEDQALIENMAQNEYCIDADKKKMGVFGVSDNTTILLTKQLLEQNVFNTTS